MMSLVVIILTYNESTHIVDCIEAAAFADEVIVFDSYSQDDTARLAENAGATVFQRSFDNFASQRNAALQVVSDRAQWVLFVDADERITPELAHETLEVIHMPDYAAWRIPRYNYLFGKLTRGAGWYPDYQTRLLRVGSAHYNPDRPVHETAILQGPEGTMQHHFIHYNYDDVAQFRAKQNKYLRYDAQMMFDQGVRPKLQNYILQPLRHFRWRFFTLKGYQDGWHGFHLSAMMAWYEFRKYVALRRILKHNDSG